MGSGSSKEQLGGMQPYNFFPNGKPINTFSLSQEPPTNKAILKEGSSFELPNADSNTKSFMRLILECDSMPDSRVNEKLVHVLEAKKLLTASNPRLLFQLIVNVREGECYLLKNSHTDAKKCFLEAITRAEKKIASEKKEMYLVLSEYVRAMIGLSRVWYTEEKESKGFSFTNPKNRNVSPVAEGAILSSDRKNPEPVGETASIRSVNDSRLEEARAASIVSLNNSVSSDGGSVFSLSYHLLKAMLPKDEPRAAVSQLHQVSLKSPHVDVNTAYLHEVEEAFVLQNSMKRELLASPCELLLLRCCEVLELMQCKETELLIDVLAELAELYKNLSLFSRGIMLLRRCIGICITAFDYDHPRVVELQGKINDYHELSCAPKRDIMATKIQSVWRMYMCMCALEEKLGHPVHRHVSLEDMGLEHSKNNDGFLDEFLLGEPEVGESGRPVQEIFGEERNNHSSGGQVTLHFVDAKVIGSSQEVVTESRVEEANGEDDMSGRVLTVQTTTRTVTVAELEAPEETSRSVPEVIIEPLPSTSRTAASSSAARCTPRQLVIRVPSGSSPAFQEGQAGKEVDDHSKENICTRTETSVEPGKEGNVLNVRQITVTETITEQPLTSSSRERHSKTFDAKTDWNEEDSFNGILVEQPQTQRSSQSESTFFTHPSDRSGNPSPPLPSRRRNSQNSSTTLSKSDQAVRESMPTGRQSGTSLRATDRDISSVSLPSTNPRPYLTVNSSMPLSHMISSASPVRAPPRVPVPSTGVTSSSSRLMSTGEMLGGSIGTPAWQAAVVAQSGTSPSTSNSHATSKTKSSNSQPTLPVPEAYVASHPNVVAALAGSSTPSSARTPKPSKSTGQLPPILLARNSEDRDSLSEISGMLSSARRNRMAWSGTPNSTRNKKV